MKPINAMFIMVFGLFFISQAVYAQNIIRDSEIENSLHQMSQPIFRAAGLNPNDVEFVIIDDSMVNAFVAGGQRIFLYTGLIHQTKDVGELLGVIAHETGHIAGGHLVRLRNVYDRASAQAIITTLAGLAAGIASGDASAGAAISMGGQQNAMLAALANTRGFENGADQAGLSFLKQANISPQGMANFLDTLNTQEGLPTSQQSAYLRTHPLTRDRLDTVEHAAQQSAAQSKPYNPQDVKNFERLKAKLLAFQDPAQALIEYPSTDTRAVAGYARLIASYKQGESALALKQLDVLLQQNPQDPYLYELRGQILHEQGQLDAAKQAYQKASSLLPNDGLIGLTLAQILIEKNQASDQNTALQLLNKAKLTEKTSPRLYRLFATLYGRQQKFGQAKLALAEEALLQNDMQQTQQQADLALQQLDKKDGPNRQRAQDILAVVQQLKKK